MHTVPCTAGACTTGGELSTGVCVKTCESTTGQVKRTELLGSWGQHTHSTHAHVAHASGPRTADSPSLVQWVRGVHREPEVAALGRVLSRVGLRTLELDGKETALRKEKNVEAIREGGATKAEFE